MSKLYFTPRGLLKMQADIDRIQAELTEMQSRLATVCETGGDVWHDNASYDYLTGDIRQTDHRLRELSSMLSRRSVVARPTSAVGVDIGTRIKVLHNGSEAEWVIAGFGESDFEAGILAYNTPLADLILGKRVGAEVEGVIAKRPVKIKVLSIAIESSLWEIPEEFRRPRK